MSATGEGQLGRRTPTDWKHVEKYPLSALKPTTALMVESVLKLPSWHWRHDQGGEGECVAFGESMMMSILNERRYDPHWLYRQAQLVDEWDDTPPGEGTSCRAGADVLRKKGHKRKSFWQHGALKNFKPQIVDGIRANRWATDVDEMRTCLANKIPVTIGVNWYTDFDVPQLMSDGAYAIGRYRNALGSIRGGHAVCVYGASDRRQGFRIKNSWGRGYPLVWMPYETMQRLLDEDGEATLVTDR